MFHFSKLTGALVAAALMVGISTANVSASTLVPGSTNISPNAIYIYTENFDPSVVGGSRTFDLTALANLVLNGQVSTLEFTGKFKDLVVMWHRFRYTKDNTALEIHASLAVIGHDQTHTAMARTVGLPIAMACKLVLNGKVNDRGVLLPLKPEIYDPVLDELETSGVVFDERVV